MSPPLSELERLDMYEAEAIERSEIQGEHLKEWESLGIPMRCCFWCTLNDVNKHLRELVERDRSR